MEKIWLKNWPAGVPMEIRYLQGDKPLCEYLRSHAETWPEKTASWTNTIGSAELGTVWTDPDFDPKQKAFYYARVIEIPTPRWSTYDAFRFGIEIPEGAPVSTQERAYTSPIWYTPGS